MAARVPAGLSRLADAFATRNSFYVLGAGASAPHVPPTAFLSDLLIEPFLRRGVFQVEPFSRDELTKRVVQLPAYGRDPMLRELVERIPPNYVAAKLPELLAVSREVSNANYEVFNLAAAPATIFNLNVDGLASHLARQHRVLEPHGRTLPPERFADLKWNDYASAILDFPDLPPPSIRRLILPGPEPAAVLTSKEYQVSASALFMARYIVLIGYGFGNMDDVHTYEFLTSNIPRHHQAIVVASMDPYPLVHRLSEKLNSSRVYAIESNWQFLADAILNPIECRKWHLPIAQNFCTHCVWYRYESLLDRFA